MAQRIIFVLVFFAGTNLAHSETTEEQKARLSHQLHQIRETLITRYRTCLSNTPTGREGAFSCERQYKIDDADVVRAATFAWVKEFLRLAITAMSETEAGWKQRDLVIKDLLRPLRKTKTLPNEPYICAKGSLNVGDLVLQTTAVPTEQKIVAGNGATFLASVPLSSDLSQNECNFSLHLPSALESCSKPNAVLLERGMFYNSCQILDLNCKLLEHGDIVLASMCVNSECSELRALPQIEVVTVLTTLSKLPNESLRERLFEIKNGLLLNGILSRCCNDKSCSENLNRLHVLQPGTPPTQQQIPPPAELPSELIKDEGA